MEYEIVRVISLSTTGISEKKTIKNPISMVRIRLVWLTLHACVPNHIHNALVFSIKAHRPEYRIDIVDVDS